MQLRWKRIKSLLIKEMRTIWRDKKSRLILILPPLLQLFIFSLAATLDVKDVPIAVLNRDYGKPAHELVERFKGSTYFPKVIYLKSDFEIREVIDTQKALMVLYIDENFSRNLLSEKKAQIQIILDGRKSNTAQIVYGYASRIVDQYNNDLAAEFGFPTSPARLVPRNWYNPNLLYPWFTVPGLVGILTMVITLIVTALSIAREREMGTFEQLLVSPLTPIDILIGKTLPAMFIGMLEGTLILIAAISAFDIPFTGSIVALYLSMFFFTLAIVGIGLFISSLCKTQQQALLAAFVFMAPAVTLSGFATPIENMPLLLQKMTYINPLRHFLVIVRGVFLKAMPAKLVLQYSLPIIVIALLNLMASTWFFRRRLE